MNELQRTYLLGKPDLIRPWCACCMRRSTNHHHVIPKGMGGTILERQIPLISLCGMGNASGCHGKAHSGRIHFRWVGWWEFVETDPCTYQEALAMDGWRPCYEEVPW